MQMNYTTFIQACAMMRKEGYVWHSALAVSFGSGNIQPLNHCPIDYADDTVPTVVMYRGPIAHNDNWL